MHPIGLIAVALALLIGAPEGPAPWSLPDVVEVQRRATSYARLNLSEVASWKRKARLAALVPKIQVDYGNRFKNIVDIDIGDNVYVGSSGVVVGPEDGKYSSNYSSDHNIGFRAIWEFSDVVFNPRQLVVSAEMRRVAHARNSLMSEVSRHYYIVAGFAEEAKLLRRLGSEAKSPRVIDHKLFVRRIACEESKAALDGLTGGWFTRQMEGEPCTRS